MKEEVQVSKYDEAFDADHREESVASGFDIGTMQALREEEDSQPRTFRHAFWQSVLAGTTDEYWAKRGNTPIEDIGEVYEMELSEAGK